MAAAAFRAVAVFVAAAVFRAAAVFVAATVFAAVAADFPAANMSRPAVGHTPSFSTPAPDHQVVLRLVEDGSLRPVKPGQPLDDDRQTVDRRRCRRASGNTCLDRRRPGTLPARNDWARHDWYHGHWHGHWDHPWNRWPNGWIGAGVAWGLAAATPWSWGYWPYYNPYYVAPIVAGGTTIDYSQPILAAGQDVVPPEQLADQAPPADQSAQLLDAARDAFAQGDYSAALAPSRSGHRRAARRPRGPRVPQPDLFRPEEVQRGGGRRLRGAVGRPRLGLDDLERLLPGRGPLHPATPRSGAVRGSRIPTRPTSGFCWPTST